MPSRKPRIALTVPDELDSVLDRLSDLTGTPKTKLIVEILEQHRPIFERAVHALELIQSDKSNSENIAKAFVGEMLLEGSEKLGSLAAEIKKG